MLKLSALLLLFFFAACGQKAASAGSDAARGAAAPLPAALPPPVPVAAAPDAAPVACTVEGDWTVAVSLTGAEPPPEEKCRPAPEALHFKVAAGGKVSVEAPKKWNVEMARVEAAGCALEVSANGAWKGTSAGVNVTLEPGPDGFTGKGQWAEEEGACPRDLTAKATRK